MSKKSKTQDEQHRKQQKEIEKDTTPDWTQCCDNCGQSPIVPVTAYVGHAHLARQILWEVTGESDTCHHNTGEIAWKMHRRHH